MSTSSQALGLGSGEERNLRILLATANDAKRKQLEKSMQKAINDAIKEGDLSAANVNAKIAAHLRTEIPEITRPQP